MPLARPRSASASAPLDAAAFVPRLVPELLVADLSASLRSWCGLRGFTLADERPGERFAHLDLGGAQVILEEEGHGRNGIAGTLERPHGRGVDLRVAVTAIDPIVAALTAAGRPLFMEPDRRWYRTGTVEVGVHQFLVQDPDGDLIRLSAPSGGRPAA